LAVIISISFKLFSKTVAIDTQGGNLILKIKSRAQQITLNPNIIKVKNVLANVSLFTIQHLQSNLNEFTGYGRLYIFTK
jgi:hypothetical protein